MKFVIFHGAFGSPEGNWFPELAEKLKSLGQEVIIPRFPVEDWGEVEKTGPKFSPQKQSLKNWFSVFEKEVLPKINKGEKLCFIGHSLGPVFILHVADKYNLKLDSAIFVSPFMEKIGGKFWQFDLVNASFYKKDFNFGKLKKLIPISYVLYSPNDPYVDTKYPIKFAQKLGSSQILVTRAGHLNSEVNLNEFPLVYELCKTRLDLSLYQQYLAHRRELFAVDYIKDSEEVIYIKPSEVFDEGIFHFRNLKKGGFCTLFTGTSFWDTQSKYMRECRFAAKRTGSVIRVFVIENISDLKRPLLREQIELDLQGGVIIYFCHLRDIEKFVKDPDFGIWDEDYVCTVRFDKNKKANEVQMSSRKTDIEEALQWEEKILKVATRIHNASADIESFLKTNR